MPGKLYAITDRKLMENNFEYAIEQAIRGGAELIQLREKGISDEEYIKRAISALEVCRKYHVPLIINDSIDVCISSGADGVHLGNSDSPPEQARKILGNDAIIGVSAKTVEQAIAAARSGANYIGCGAVFGTSTKNDAKKMDISTLKEITAASPIPVFAIGGINNDNVNELKNTGIYGIAVISGIFCGDVYKNAQSLNEAVQCL